MTELGQRFEEIYKSHYKALRNAAEQIVGDQDAAHDVVQEVFLKLWHRKDELGVILNERAYLMRSVVNTSITHLSKNKKNRELQDHHAEWDGSTDRGILEKELQRKIETALETLPPKCKAIFVLSRLENMKNKEIAGLLGLSLKTVENQMGIALKKMKTELKEYFKGETLLVLVLSLTALLRWFF
jgi:RNA polymerase sigma-70 factor (family 1)